MDYSRTVSETFYGPDCPMDKEMRNWGRSGMTSYCSIVCSGSGSPSTSPVLGLLPIVHNFNKYNDLGSAFSGGDLGLWQSNLTSWLQIWGGCCHSSELQMSYPTHEVSPHPLFNLPLRLCHFSQCSSPLMPQFLAKVMNVIHFK